MNIRHGSPERTPSFDCAALRQESRCAHALAVPHPVSSSSMRLTRGHVVARVQFLRSQSANSCSLNELSATATMVSTSSSSVGSSA
jgi:hypothetical protein